MKTKIKLALILCLCVAFSMDVNAQSSSKLNLKACIDMALANNIAVKQSDLLQQVAKLNYDQAKFDRLPNVSADVNYGINSGRSIDPYTNAYSNQNLSSSNAALTASVPVFRGLQIQNNIKQTSLTYQATKMELQQQKDNLILNVILAFLQVINDEDVLALTKKQIDVTSKQVERLDQLNKEGAIAPATFYDMKGQYATDQLAVLNSARSLEMSKLGLAQFMNIPYSKDMQVDREGTDLTIAAYAGTADNIFSKALQDLAMVKAADLRTKAANQGIRVAAAGLYPTVSLFGQLGTNFSSAARRSTLLNVTDVATSDYVVVNGTNSPVFTKQSNYSSQKINFFSQYNNNLNTYVGLNINVPIFSSFKTRTNVRLARLEEKRNSYIAENTKIQLRQAIEQAVLNMTTAWDRYKVLQEQVAAFEESFRAAEIRFNLGALNSVEYLIIKNNLDRANINLAVAKYEYLLRTKVLDFYQGKLQ